jgi:translation initiation factor IF-3
MPLMNEKILAPKLQLITDDGQNVGVITRMQALEIAREAGLDLVIIAESGGDNVPVAQIMDLGKVLYKKKKKQAEAKKHQKVIQIKEIKIRPKISEHDFQTKMKQGMAFLNAGKHLKVTLFFRGRENITKDKRGPELFDQINKTFEEHGLLQNLAQEGESRMGSQWSRIYYLKKLA